VRVAHLARELTVLSSAFLIGCSGSSEKHGLPKLVVSPGEVDLEGERLRIRGVTFDGAGGKPETDAVSSEPVHEHKNTVRWTVPTERGIHRLLIRVDTDLKDTDPVSVPWSVVVS